MNTIEAGIIISPFSRKLPNGVPDNPKDYPYWGRVIDILKHDGYSVIQVGIDGEKQLVDDFRKNLKLKELRVLLHQHKTWISVDNFFHHLAWLEGVPGVVLFGQSDPKLFGHPENTNLLKSRNYLRKQQYQTWMETIYKSDAFVNPELVVSSVQRVLIDKN